MTVGTEKISVGEYDYYYYAQISNYVSSLSYYNITPAQMGLDTTKPLDEQYYTAGDSTKKITWEEYFREQAESTVEQMTQLYLEAKANGATLPDTSKKKIGDTISNLKASCKSSNITLDSYLAQAYGKGVNEAVFRKVLERIYLADYYSKEKDKTFQYSAAQIQDYYSKNKADFDEVDYRSFFFNGAVVVDSGSSTGTAAGTGTGTGTSTDNKAADAQTEALKKAAMEQAKQFADMMLSQVTNEASFEKLALDNASADQKDTYKKPEATLTKAATSSDTSDQMKAWLFDDSRKPGDKTVVASDTGYTVLYMVSRYRNTDPTVNVRHILISYDTSSSETSSGTSSGTSAPTDAQKAAAKSTAEEIYSQWKKGDKTEDSFAKLAEEKSGDSGSSTNGGLYQDIYPGEMTGAFNDWCFDSSRKPGDTGIVETDYGYHIMYFRSKGEVYWITQVRSKLVSNAHSDFMSSLGKKYKVAKYNFGMSLTAVK